MFNIIIGRPVSPQGSDEMPMERMLTYTEDATRERLTVDTEPDLVALRELPTLMMDEGKREGVARIVNIVSAKKVKTSVEFEYSIDEAIPPLTNAQIYGLRYQLGLDEFQFSRTHWSVNDRDLFKVLLKAQTLSQPLPTAFKLPQKAVQPKLISFMMPFDGAFTGVFQTVKKTLASDGFICKRADDIWENHAVMDDVLELLVTARVVICDFSRKNANVFYETGIAQTLGKDTIIVTQSGGDVPFDLQHQRYIPYLNNEQGHIELAERIHARIKTIIDNGDL
jgi:hypothetical protein